MASTSSAGKSLSRSMQRPPPKSQNGWRIFKNALPISSQRVNWGSEDPITVLRIFDMPFENDDSLFLDPLTSPIAQLGGRSVAQTAELAPAWVPDTETTHCMHCKKTVFGFVNRRHHCRKCGIVACNGCTTKRFLLPNQSRYGRLYRVLNQLLRCRLSTCRFMIVMDRN